MSIATELQNYADGLGDAYDAVNDMSGIIPQHKNMNNLDQAIRTIPQNSGITATTFHWGGSPNYSMYKDSGYTTAATYSDIATAYAGGLVYIADGEDEVTYVVVSDIPDAHTITVTGIGLPDYEGGSTSYTYASSTWTKTATEFQKKLTAGTNVQINGTTISATDTTYSDMVGATSLDAGTHGLVPAPAAGDEAKVLSGAGTWVNQPTIPTVPTKTSDLTNNGDDGTHPFIATDDYATNQTAGAVKVTSSFGVEMSNSGEIKGAVVSSADYPSMWNDAIVSKGTLENALSTKGYALSTDIPTVNDATLTITQNGTTAGTFSANASSAATIALTDTTYSDMTGATSSVAGAHGLVPAPAAGDESKVLSGAGTWVSQPTVPTVNNATLTIQKNGSTVKTFTANASSDVTANISVPTQFSDLSGTVGSAQFADNTIASTRLASADCWVLLGSTKSTSSVTNNRVLYLAIPSGWRSTSLRIDVMFELSSDGWVDLRAYDTNGTIINHTANTVWSINGSGGGTGEDGVAYICNAVGPGTHRCVIMEAESFRPSGTTFYRSWISKSGYGYGIRVTSALAKNGNDVGSIQLWTNGTAKAGAWLKIWGRKD